jgi:hypothetical protein
VLVDAVEFFRTDPRLSEQYARCLRDGKRLRVCLEADEGHAKADLLWRLSNQGYGVFQLPFVPWLLSSQHTSVTGTKLQQLSKLWQADWMAGALHADSGRPGLLFVARSPWTSALELSRRFGETVLLPELPDSFVVVKLEADSIQVQRRVAEKTFNEPESVASKLRNELRTFAPLPTSFQPHASINSTSGKQGTAALLKLVGVQAPSFPQWKH